MCGKGKDNKMYLSKNVTPKVRKRQNIEIRILKASIQALLNAGYSISVNDGEETFPQTTNVKTIYKQVFNTDLDKFYVYRNGVYDGFVCFVYGNEGWDVISDYSLTLESVLAPVNALADKLEK